MKTIAEPVVDPTTLQLTRFYRRLAEAGFFGDQAKRLVSREKAENKREPA